MYEADPAYKIMQILAEMSDTHRLKLLQSLDEKICPECGSLALREIDNECYCMNCATKRNNGENVKHLTNYIASEETRHPKNKSTENAKEDNVEEAFEEENGSFTTDFKLGSQGKPPTNLAFGRGQGNTITRKDLYQVLAKGVGGSKDVGLRARQIRIFQSCSEHPTIRNMLENGSELCEEFGMIGRDAVFFADYLGRFLRKVGAAAILQKTNGQSIEARRLSITTFVYVWQLMERDRGLRPQITFEPIFPGRRRISEGTWQGMGIKPNRYKIRSKDWDFVLWSVMMQPEVPTTKKPLMEDPQVLRLIQMGRALCHQWFVHGQWQNPKTNTIVEEKEFFDKLQKNLIKVGGFWVGSGIVFSLKSYTNACFALTMKDYGAAEYLHAGERLNVDPNLISSVLAILRRTK